MALVAAVGALLLRHTWKTSRRRKTAGVSNWAFSRDNSISLGQPLIRSVLSPTPILHKLNLPNISLWGRKSIKGLFNEEKQPTVPNTGGGRRGDWGLEETPEVWAEWLPSKVSGTPSEGMYVIKFWSGLTKVISGTPEISFLSNLFFRVWNF